MRSQFCEVAFREVAFREVAFREVAFREVAFREVPMAHITHAPYYHITRKSLHKHLIIRASIWYYYTQVYNVTFKNMDP